jgi:hypothetical protein
MARTPTTADAAGLVVGRDPEAGLRGVWAEVLGVPHVGPFDNFFDLGGDSMLVLQMLSRAREIGVDFDLGRLGEFLEDATCARLLELTGGAPPSGAVAPASDVTIIALRPAADATNVFVLLPTMHDLWAVRELSARIPGAAFQVLVPGWAPARPYTSMPALGASMAGAIQAVQPHGPYRLVGSCAAGQAAVEAAMRLAGGGDAFDLLALVDTRAPAPVDRPPSLLGLMPVGRGGWRDLGELVPKLLWLDRMRAAGHLPPDRLLAHLWTAIRLHVGDLMIYLTEVEPERWDEAFRDRAARSFMAWLNYQVASEHYEIAPSYDGRLSLVYGERPDAECQDPAAAAAAWRHLSGAACDLHVFEEVHSSAMLTSRVLVELIERSLRLGAAAG